jgi:hypothetical protein
MPHIVINILVTALVDHQTAHCNMLFIKSNVITGYLDIESLAYSDPTGNLCNVSKTLVV